MYIQFIHSNGKVYELPVTQVTVFAEDGQPCAVSYAHAGLIVHTDITDKDFDRTCAQLKIKKLVVP